ncbi:MAG: OmpA family protein, partial [Chitinophagales bacterium]
PSVSEDGNSLYFVSRNVEGGLGGSDIWLLEKKGSGWGAPQTVEGINTEYDEAYPVLFDENTLYFSSSGFVGMGALDLFVSERKNGKWSAPENLRVPFNSNADDFLLVQKSDKSEGYFSSNRSGGQGSDDIYSFYLKPVNLLVKGQVLDVDSGTGLENVMVYLTVNDQAVDSTLTDAGGNYQFELEQDRDYKLKLNKPEYFGDSRKLSTDGEKYSKTFSKANGHDFDFALMRIPKEEITIEDIYYDYNSYNLRPNSKENLNKLVKLLEDSPDVEVMINAHTDDRGNPKYNLELSQKRAQAVVDYLIEKGINPVRLQSKGWGKTALLIENAKTEEEHQKNRRTTFKVLNQ